MGATVKLSDKYVNADRQAEEIANLQGGLNGPNWVATATSGTVAAIAAHGGGLSITTQAADNAIGQLALAAAVFQIAAGKALLFAGRIQYAEAATNQANVAIGLISGTVANALQNNGAGPQASYTGAMFYKVDTGTVWICESAIATVKQNTVLQAGNNVNKVTRTAGGPSYVLFEIDIMPKNQTQCDIVYRMDGVTVCKHTDVVFTGGAVMAPFAYIKAGSSTAEVLKINLMKFCYVI